MCFFSFLQTNPAALSAKLMMILSLQTTVAQSYIAAIVYINSSQLFWYPGYHNLSHIYRIGSGRKKNSSHSVFNMLYTKNVHTCCAVITAFLLATLSIDIIDGSPNGAPTQACATMTPGHGVDAQLTSSSPFKTEIPAGVNWKWFLNWRLNWLKNSRHSLLPSLFPKRIKIFCVYM